MGTEFKVVELTYPITYKDEAGIEVNISSLQLSRIKMKHIKLIPKSLLGEVKKGKKKTKDDEDEKFYVNPVDLLPLISGLSGLSIEKVEEIDVVDIGKVSDMVAELMGEM
jgi:hypothetical protein